MQCLARRLLFFVNLEPFYLVLELFSPLYANSPGDSQLIILNTIVLKGGTYIQYNCIIALIFIFCMSV